MVQPGRCLPGAIWWRAGPELPEAKRLGHSTDIGNCECSLGKAVKFSSTTLVSWKTQNRSLASSSMQLPSKGSAPQARGKLVRSFEETTMIRGNA